MKRFLLIFALLAFLGVRAFGQTTYYVDPLYSGGGSTGAPAHPWTTLASGWSTINTSLASGAVTVYLSACNPGCTAAETSSSQIDLTQRSNTSTNILTLDGISQYNTNSATPSWATNVIPAPCTGWRCAVTAPWGTGAKKFTVTGTTPITGSTNFASCPGYFTVQGFVFANSEGQSGDLTYLHDITIQYNEFTRTATGSYGPGVIIGPAQHGPCHTGAARPSGTDSGPDNVTVQYNYIHATWGECIYIGASSSDPFNPAGGTTNQQYEAGVSGDNLQCGNGCTSNSLVCTTTNLQASTCSTGANYLVAYNTLESCASWGGQGDGTDVKDGHTNLRVIGNTYRTSLACTGCGSNGPGNDGQGPLFESGAQEIGNYIEAPGHQCTPIYSSWNNSVGRGDMEIINNMCINANSGSGSNVAFNVWPPTQTGEATWSTVEMYNNTVYDNDDNCLVNQSGSGATVTAYNNICWATGSISGTFTRDYNDIASNTETHGISGNPDFVSTTPPYIDTDFEITSGSPTRAAGTNLHSTFTTDYFGDTRPNSAFDIGADQFTSGSTPTPAPALGMFAWDWDEDVYEFGR